MQSFWRAQNNNTAMLTATDTHKRQPVLTYASRVLDPLPSEHPCMPHGAPRASTRSSGTQGSSTCQGMQRQRSTQLRSYLCWGQSAHVTWPVGTPRTAAASCGSQRFHARPRTCKPRNLPQSVTGIPQASRARAPWERSPKACADAWRLQMRKALPFDWRQMVSQLAQQSSRTCSYPTSR